MKSSLGRRSGWVRSGEVVTGVSVRGLALAAVVAPTARLDLFPNRWATKHYRPHGGHGVLWSSLACLFRLQWKSSLADPF